ncbi:FecR family protein [Desulfolutivibrio sulfoxidireducens]|uniref:FecR family protein n=1 Tax=Desulfolutivibrio sulfoxidireducens TaxID=2773299 RepID=UPI00159DAFE7|nr:FecR domain-containing protein [Desulfolutivibrio sulfoxidireducens]
MKTCPVRFALCLLCLLFSVPAAWAGAEKPAGYVQEATGQVLAARDGQSRPLNAKDPVWRGDTLATKAESTVQIMFSDGTTLVMGPESLLAVTEFVNEWGADKALSNRMEFSYGPGVFRAVTGMISERNPAAFKVETPLGLIGIRGTELGSLVAAPAQAGGKPFGQALGDVFAAKGNAAASLLANLWTASAGGVPREVHAHLSGFNKRPLAFTDKMGKTVNMAVGQGVTVTRERGASEAGPISKDLDTVLPSASINTKSKVPAAYKSTLGDTPGSNKNGSEGSDSGGGGCGG